MNTENVSNEEKCNIVLADVMAMLPSVDDAGVIAVNVASNVRPKLTVQEEAMFIAGFQECVKYLSMQGKAISTKHLLSAVTSIEQIEEVARQYFEAKYPLMDLSNDEDKYEIDWWDMLQFVQHVLSCHCR